jgi:hypothetical protein
MVVSPSNRRQSGGNTKSTTWTTILLGLAAFIIITPIFNYIIMSKSISKSDSTADLLEKNRQLEERIRQLESSSAAAVKSSSQKLSQQQQLSPLQIKANSINRYWWPSHTDGGLIGKIYIQQHPSNCKSSKTKYLVWRSRQKPEDDTRGLTAWGHAGSSNLLHAFTDADSVPHYPSRVLINDDKVCM